MYNIKHCVIACLCLVGLIAVMPEAANAGTKPMLNSKLEETVRAVKSAGSPMEQIRAAQHLAELTKGVPALSVDDATVSDITSLLDMPEDAVRGWVAAALGHLGRRAKVAAPKLLALLPEADCMQGDLTSAASIRPALKRMGVEPPPAPTYSDCQKAK